MITFTAHGSFDQSTEYLVLGDDGSDAVRREGSGADELDKLDGGLKIVQSLNRFAEIFAP